MTRMFKPPLGKKIEIYIDDMVVKSKVEFEHVDDLESIFAILRKHKLPRGGGGSICLHCDYLSCGESGADTGWWWGTESSLLYEQVIARDRGSLFTIGEGHLGSGTCYMKAPSLLTSSHHCGSYLTPSSITASKSWLHREDYKMGMGSENGRKISFQIRDWL